MYDKIILEQIKQYSQAVGNVCLIYPALIKTSRYTDVGKCNVMMYMVKQSNLDQISKEDILNVFKTPDNKFKFLYKNLNGSCDITETVETVESTYNLLENTLQNMTWGVGRMFYNFVKLNVYLHKTLLCVLDEYPINKGTV